MTTKTLSGVYQAAYVLSSPITTLTVAAGGYFAQGVSAAATGAYTVVNHGDIMNTNTTSGDYSGLFIAGAAVVTNSGAIKSYTTTTSGAGVVIGDGGTLANQAGGLIVGYSGAEIAGSAGTIANSGEIVGVGKYGVVLTEGGVVTNGGTAATGAIIRGDYAIVTAATVSTLHNYGTVIGTGTVGIAAYLHAGGLVTNGSKSDTSALITATGAGLGFGSAAGTVINFGTVRSTGTAGAAVILSDGGMVTNGSTADTSALLSANVLGVASVGQAATVDNFGSIFGGYQTTASIAGAVYLAMGGSVTNGSSADTTAHIGGLVGVAIEGAAGSVVNFGAVGGVSAEIGMLLADGGMVTNGSTTDTGALIQGYIGVGFETISGTFDNFGTVIAGEAPASLGELLPGVFLGANGVVDNGSNADTIATIGGVVGVYASSTSVGTVANFGTITGSLAALDLQDGGKITNGSATDTGAQMIGGEIGAAILGAIGTLSNFGVIRGGQAMNTFGAGLLAGGALTNGGATDHAATISGWIAADAAGAAKITNFGALQGGAASGAGVELGTGASLTNEAGGVISGYIGAAVSSGATATNFGLMEGGAGGAVTLTDTTSRINLEAGSSCVGMIVANAGVVDVVSGTAAASGVTTSGKLEGAGVLSLDGGVSAFEAGAALVVSGIAVSGAATVVDVDAKFKDADRWTQSGGALSIAAADQMEFTGAGDTFTGTIAGAGAVLFGGGSDTLDDVSFSVARATVKNAALTLAGDVTATGMISVTSPDIVVAAAGATLAGGGVIALSNLATNSIEGATAAATLTNDDTIRGGGKLGGGGMSLVNAGTIEADGSVALTISTGSDTVINSGLIEALSAGHTLTLLSAVDNTGTLGAIGGTLLVEGGVTGAGGIHISGGDVFVAGALAEKVGFGTSGRLALADSRDFTGQIAGFSLTGGTSLDLEDIDFASATASYSGTTKSGVLTVSDGTHTARITLLGNYTASTWTLSNDGSGGVSVVDPTAHAPAAAQANALASAAASFGAAGVGAGPSAREAAGAPPPLLAVAHA